MNEFERCDPQDISLKTFFLGPQAENREWLMHAVQVLFQSWFNWRENYYPKDGEAISSSNRSHPDFLLKQKKLMENLQTLIRRFEDEVPKFTPRYMGHMLSEQSLPALLGHIVTLLHNPNNISGESSRVGIQIEREAVDDLCAMIGWVRGHSTGHFTSGGTLANFEGLLRAQNRVYQWMSLGAYLREQNKSTDSLFEMAHMGWTRFDERLALVDKAAFAQWKQQWLSNPIRFAKRIRELFEVEFEGPVLLVPESKHYSWPKATQLLGMGRDRLLPIRLDPCGRMEVRHLKTTIEHCRNKQIPISCIVSVAGTTEFGTIDPIDEISSELNNICLGGVHLWHHVDAAYGGFLAAMLGMRDEPELSDLLRKIGALQFANSVTIDPHKLGYVPYASGVLLVRERREYAYQEITAPYIQFNSDQDVGLQTLEGSRSAAGAVATWLTERAIGLNAEGYGRILARTIAVRKLMAQSLQEASPLFYIPCGLDTNVLCFSVIKKGGRLSEANSVVEKIYEIMAPGKKSSFILSKTNLRFENYEALLSRMVHEREVQKDTESVEFLRLCLMNPFIVSKETNVFFPEALVKELQKCISNML